MNFNQFRTYLFRRKSSRRNLVCGGEDSCAEDYYSTAAASGSEAAADEAGTEREASISCSTPSLRISSAPSTRGSLKLRNGKASTPPPPSPSPSSLPRPPPPPPPPKPILGYDRNKISSAKATKSTTTVGEASKPIGIEAKKSFEAGELTLSCPSMLIDVVPASNHTHHSAIHSADSRALTSSNIQLRSPYLLENGFDGLATDPHRSSQIPAFLHPTDTCPNCCSSSRELDLLRNETRILRAELAESRKTISLMREKEKLLRLRLSEQARRQLERGSTKFEDINLGENRPSQLIRRYGNLYSEGRLEAMEALDELQEVAEFDDLKEKLLLSVIVLAFRNAKKNLDEMKAQMRRLLHISDLSSSSSSSSSSFTASPTGNDSSLVPRSKVLPPQHPAVVELDAMMSVFLRKTVDHQNLSKSCQEVRDRVWSTLYDFPKLRFCRGLQRYIEDCVRLAWVLTIQHPAFVVDYKATVFSVDTHTRFHTSNPDSDRIRSILWPALREGSETGPCVHKGIVIT